MTIAHIIKRYTNVLFTSLTASAAITHLQSGPKQTIFMAALWNRAGHYIFMLWFLSSIFVYLFFPRLISAAGDWMSTILPHMVGP